MDNSRIRLFTESNVTVALMKLGLPMVASMLVTAIYNVVDTYFVAGLGTGQAAAVAVAFPLSLAFSGVGLTFGVGAASYLSRLLGMQEYDEARKVSSVAAFTSLGVAAVLVVAAILGLEPVLSFMGASDRTIDLAMQYGRVFVVAAGVSAFNVAVGNIAVAQGAPTVTLGAMFAGSLLNIVLDPVLIYAAGMGVVGAAIATLVAQLVTTCIYGWFFLSARATVPIGLRFFRPTAPMYWEIIKIGISTLLLQLMQSISMSLISRAAVSYGDEAVAAMGFTLRVVALGVSVVVGYMKGFQPLVGFNYGAKNVSRVRAAIKSCLAWTTGFCVAFSALVFAFAPQIMSFFSTDPEVLGISTEALRINCLLFFTLGFQYTFATLYIALGKALVGGLLTVCRQGVMFIPVILALSALFGLEGIMWSQNIADILSTAITAIFAIWILRRSNDGRLRQP